MRRKSINDVCVTHTAHYRHLQYVTLGMSQVATLTTFTMLLCMTTGVHVIGEYNLLLLFYHCMCSFFGIVPIAQSVCIAFVGSDWLALLPFVGTLSFLVYVTVLAFKPKSKPEDTAINMKIQKESDKVVHVVDIEDLGKKTVYCRCWRSKKVCLTGLFSYGYGRWTS